MSLLWPISAGGLAAGLLSNLASDVEPSTLLLAGIGVIALVLGYRWYGVAGMGLRGGRPLMSGIGFAFLGWIALLIARFVAVELAEGEVVRGLLGHFFFLLLFEALCVQLWCYGLFFRSMAEWRHPLTAVATSGILFGMCAYFFFGEALIARETPAALIFFIVWGIFYGIIRLRTGSLLGPAVIQAMQSLTVWHLLPLSTRPGAALSLTYLYGITGVVLLVLIWRLRPRFVSDFRI